MKSTKRLLVLLIAVLMLAVCAAPAFANIYNVLDGSTTGAGSNGLFSITEWMALEKNDTAKPIVSYVFAVSGNAIVSPTYGAAGGVSGNPAVTDATKQVNYNADTVYSAGDGSNYSRVSPTHTVTFDFSNVQFSKPGVYYWKVTKTATTGTSNAEAVSNNNLSSQVTASSTPTEFYIYAIVTNAGDSTTVSGTSDLQVTYGCYEGADVTNTSPSPNNAKNDDIEDRYPASATDLYLKKQVTGQLGDKTLPFPFVVSISTTDTSMSGTYNLEYYKDGVKQTGTINGNPTTITLNAASGTTISLAHDEMVKLVGLPEGAGYTITEDTTVTGGTSQKEGFEDYNVSATVTGDVTGVTNNADSTGVVSDTKLQSETTVTFTNSKTTTPPTGILLNNLPGVIAILVAAVGLVVLLISRRRKKEDYSAQ